jgi:hypothetical protein
MRIRAPLPKRNPYVFRIVILISVLGFFTALSAASANHCSLNGKTITGQVVTCDKKTRRCDQGTGIRIKFVGNKILTYSTDDTGLIYTIGQTINILTDPSHYSHFTKLERENQTGLRFSQYLITATMHSDILTLKQDTIHVVQGTVGKSVTVLAIKFADCKTCQVIAKNTDAWDAGKLVWSASLRRQFCEMQ